MAATPLLSEIHVFKFDNFIYVIIGQNYSGAMNILILPYAAACFLPFQCVQMKKM